MGYRWYEANGVKPLFPFGFGLSYTTFAYGGLSVVPGVNPQTGQPVLTVTYTITNTGSRQGAEASQVYLTLPAAAEQPSKRLVGFQKVDLVPGATEQVTVIIDSSASNHPFSYWVPENDAPVAGWSKGAWNMAVGDYTVHVGGSSADTPLVQTIALPPAASPSPSPSPISCTTIRPGPDWVCVNGGWLPPGAAGARSPTPNPTPTPNVPTSCATIQPGPDWVCVNGGWLPPGATGAPSPTPSPTPTPNAPASCPTVKPGPDWVCVNGGWLPPGAAGTPAPTPTPGPTPTPNVPASCQTVQPAPDWACVNGGWRRPANRFPSARQAASSLGQRRDKFQPTDAVPFDGKVREGSMGRVLQTVPVAALVSVGLIFTQEVVPRAQGAPSLPWMNTSLSPEQRADLLIPQMTLEQKVQQLSNDVRPAQDPANRPKGCGFAGSGRHIQGIPALGIPTVRMTNGGTGIIGGDCKPNPVGTGVPSTIALGATFNPGLGRQLGDVLGNEARLHGHQVLLGPTVTPVRHPYGGRNYQNGTARIRICPE